MTNKSSTKAPVVSLETPEVPAEPTPLEVFVEHQRKAFTEAGKAMLALLPENFQTHSEAAVKEAIEGYRSLVNKTLDDIIETLKKAKVEPEKPAHKK
ncbi:MAG: hypothetical protein KF716_17350 [Anaerolineae bacterium]|nr:hypothetical protein [Anaerolineae bacterium]